MHRTLSTLLLTLGAIAVTAPIASYSAQTPPVEVERGSPNRQTPAPPADKPKAAAQAPPTAAPKVAFEKHTLPNGLQLILHVDRKLPIVHVNQWFHVGSKNEKPGRTGFAHLFEHMMFQGSQNVKGEYFTVAEKLGANIQEGGVNGTTDNDRTNYFATVPSGNLEQLLWLESDRLATLLDVTDLKKLDNQRDVVKNERREGLENQPYGRWIDILFNQLFPAGHPYSWPVIGSMEDLSAASLDDVKEFFRRYYTPNNLSMVIAGDFDPAEAKRLVEKYFGGLAPGPALDRPDRWIATLNDERIVEVADRVPQERTYMVWSGPEYFHRDDAAKSAGKREIEGLGADIAAQLEQHLVFAKQCPLAQDGQQTVDMVALEMTFAVDFSADIIMRRKGQDMIAAIGGHGQDFRADGVDQHFAAVARAKNAPCELIAPFAQPALPGFHCALAFHFAATSFFNTRSAGK